MTTSRVSPCMRTQLWRMGCGGALLLALACGSAPRTEGPPNIVLIIGDDHGYTDFGFMGSEHAETPQLDRLAAEGTVFTHGFATSSICTPSLRSLLTGLHPVQIDARLEQLAARGTSRRYTRELQDFITLPWLLRAPGYLSFEGGKFWEGSYETAGFTHGMTQTDAEGLRGGGGLALGRSTMEPVFRFIDDHGDTPFFLWFAPKLPHFPHDAPERFEEPFEDRGFSRRAIRYYANIARFDESVGELLEHLERRHLTENTLVVYLADNGWDQAYDAPARKRSLSAMALREEFDGPRGKKSIYELGFRTPFIFRWPGHVPAGVRRDDVLSSAVDLVATLLDYAGTDVEATFNRFGRTGLSLRGVIEDDAAWPREQVIGGIRTPRRTARPPPGKRYPKVGEPMPAWFVRSPDWYYVYREVWASHELYDVHTDGAQQRNVADAHPEVVARLHAELTAWREAVLNGLPEETVRAP